MNIIFKVLAYTSYFEREYKHRYQYEFLFLFYLLDNFFKYVGIMVF